MTQENKPLPDCWVVVKDGRIIGTNDEPAHFEGIPAVLYVPAAQPDLKALVKRVHAAKGRYRSQMAMCDLYQACGLPNVRPDTQLKANL